MPLFETTCDDVTTDACGLVAVVPSDCRRATASSAHEIGESSGTNGPLPAPSASPLSKPANTFDTAPACAGSATATGSVATTTGSAATARRDVFTAATGATALATGAGLSAASTESTSVAAARVSGSDAAGTEGTRTDGVRPAGAVPCLRVRTAPEVADAVLCPRTEPAAGVASPLAVVASPGAEPRVEPSAQAVPGAPKTAAPTPSATANPPTRPTNREALITDLRVAAS